MIEIDIEEAQTHLKEYLDKVKLGERVVVRNGLSEKFELTRVESGRPPNGQKRRIGAGVGQMTIHPSFYDPLPDDILAYFEGRAEEGVEGDSGK